MRTICPISNLSSLRQLKTLQHPYIFNQFNKQGELQQVEEVRALLGGPQQSDMEQLEELQFELRQGGGATSEQVKMLMAAIRNSHRLKKLTITVALKGELLELLNKNVGSKDANLRSLQITFASP